MTPVILIVFCVLLTATTAYSPAHSRLILASRTARTLPVFGSRKYSEQRRKKMGLGDGDDEEYDLDVALSQNTDSTITKVIAGSFILTIFALLYVGIIQPALNPVEGVCNPILTQGRC
jgi:hypothetical protein